MKQCIFDEKKVCTNCGDCDTCVFNKNKICDNCGKCLELEGYDVKAIKIDEVFEKQDDNSDEKIHIDLEDFSEFDVGDEEELLDEEFEESFEEVDDMPYIDALDNEDNWVYIDDVDGISDLLEDVTSSDDMEEKYPGLYVYKHNS